MSHSPRAGHHQLELAQLVIRVRELSDQAQAREEEMGERSRQAERQADEQQREVARLTTEVERVGKAADKK